MPAVLPLCVVEVNLHHDERLEAHRFNMTLSHLATFSEATTVLGDERGIFKTNVPSVGEQLASLAKFGVPLYGSPI